MTVAVCFKCGEFKFGALAPCPACGNFPVECADIVTSVAITDHYMSNANLEDIRQSIKAGVQVEVPAALREELTTAIYNSGYNKTIRERENDVRNEVERRKKLIQAEFFEFAKEAFVIGHSLVDYRDMITKEVGTLRSTIRNLFRSVNYTQFVEIARNIQAQALQLESDVNTLLQPVSDMERHFFTLLGRHSKALRQYSDYLVEEAEFMYKKSRLGTGTSWANMKVLLAAKQPIIQECQVSGAELTLYYHENSKYHQQPENGSVKKRPIGNRNEGREGQKNRSIEPTIGIDLDRFRREQD